MLVSREQDRAVFRELFDAFFRDPDWRTSCWRRCCRRAGQGRAGASGARGCGRRCAAASRRPPAPTPETEVDLDAAMTASDLQRLRHADFNALGADEYRLVERLARDIALPVPGRQPPHAARRPRHAGRTGRARCAKRARTGGELLPAAGAAAPPSSPCRCWCWSTYRARWSAMPACCWPSCTPPRAAHARRDVFAFGTHLTDLTPAFRLADTDAMLAAAGAAIDDFAGGTRLGDSLAELRAAPCAAGWSAAARWCCWSATAWTPANRETWQRELPGCGRTPPAAVAQPAAALRRLRAARARRGRAAPAGARHARRAQPGQAQDLAASLAAVLRT